MSIFPTITHPSFCDPRSCSEHLGAFDHRSAPMSWKPSADDRIVTVGLSQLAEPELAAVCDPKVSLTLRDTVIDGRSIDTDLDAGDARLLAAALLAAAEQVEAETRRKVTV